MGVLGWLYLEGYPEYTHMTQTLPGNIQHFFLKVKVKKPEPQAQVSIVCSEALTVIL